MKTYIGKTCKRGHNERYINGNGCVTCVTARANLRYREEFNKDPDFNRKQTIIKRAKNPNYAKEEYHRNADRYKEKARRRERDLDKRSFKHERKEIESIYTNRPDGYEVDHDIPINHELVCGLHCVANLQYLTIKDNRDKSNNWTQN